MRMRLLLLLGDQAVGKMTVGQAIAAKTPMKLFHNHMTIEPVIELCGRYDGEAVKQLREVYFDAFVRSAQYGLIFTYVFAFDMESEWSYIAHVVEKFERAGAQVDFCELVAPLATRLERNLTENRLREKPSKRDTAFSERLIRESRHRCVSEPGECPWESYLRLDNSCLSPDEAAERIIDHFGIERRGNA